MQHILSARQFDTAELETLFEYTDEIHQEYTADRRSLLGRHPGEGVATLFYEPSTRTRLSFEAAAQGLGAYVLSTENAGEFSSAIKGESIEDSIRTAGCYADVIVLRHPEKGAAERAAAVQAKPIINAGDGTGEHPTQALLDLYTIRSEAGKLQDLHVVVGGDLKHGRTARSLSQLLSAYPGNRLSFVSVPELGMGQDVKDHLAQTNTRYDETDNMFDVLHNADVVYWTRLQKERLADPTVESSFVINQAALQAMPEHAVIMHPLPRVHEIEPSVDADPRAAYFRQVQNGLFVRMALLDTMLSAEEG